MSKNYLEAFVIVLVAGALGYFLVWPKYGELQDINRQVEEKKIEIKNSNEYYANLKKIITDLGQRQDVLAKIDTAFPKHPDAPALIDFIQTAAIQSGVLLKKADYQSAAAAKSAAPVPAATKSSLSLQNYGISVSFSANYANFKNFMSRLEHSSRLINVASMSVNSDLAAKAQDSDLGAIAPSKNENDKILNYDVKLLVNYYQ